MSERRATKNTEEGRREPAATALVGAWRSVPEWIPGLVLDAEAKAGSTLHEMTPVTETEQDS